MKPFLTEQNIINCLNENYGIEVNKLTLLPIGADLHASVYKAETSNQSSYFLKLKRNHHPDISTAIIELLHKVGIRQVIPSIKTVYGQTTQSIDDFTLIVFPFIEGQNGFSCNLTKDQWRTLGKVIRQVHEIVVPTSIQCMIRHEDYSPKWREAVQSLCTHIEVNPGIDEISSKLKTFINEHSVAIHRLIDRAHQLGKQIQDQSSRLVLCHSDIHGGNVLISKNDTIHIVDWDDPIMAPKERDLMFIGAGVANVWNKPYEENFFYEGYGKTDINRKMLAYYRHERILEDIALLGQQLILRSESNRIELYQHFIDQFEPQGVVDMAFKTDENLT